MNTLDPRKLSLLRKARRAHDSAAKFAAKSAVINLDGLPALRPRKAISDIHFLPMPERLSQLLPQEHAVPKFQDRSDIASSAEVEALKKEIDSEINLRNAEMLALKARVLVMENDLVLIRKSMLRIKTFAVASSLFVLAWAVSVSLFF